MDKQKYLFSLQDIVQEKCDLEDSPRMRVIGKTYLPFGLISLQISSGNWYQVEYLDDGTQSEFHEDDLEIADLLQN